MTLVPPPPPPSSEQQEEEETKLSFVSLSLDNRTIVLNDELCYPIRLPTSLFVKNKNYEKRLKIVKDVIFEGCSLYKVDELSDDNVTRCAKEIIQLMDERERSAAAARAKEEEGQQQEQEQQQPPPKIELTEDLTREVSNDEIADILSSSIKKDDAAKLITFDDMLLNQTNEDQFNIAFQAESAAGKSYIAIELANYFPEGEIIKIASASPTAFFHTGGVWDKEKQAIIVDLRHKTIIFLDQSHFQLIERLRPMLSHDDKELESWITDKTQKYGLRTKKVIIKGPPSVIFCTARLDPDEQEKTRMLLLSPSTDQQKLVEALELSALRKSNPEEFERRIRQDAKGVWLRNRIYGIRQWGIREITIPDDGKTVFRRFISEHPHLKPRHQRDFPRIFSFVKAHALMNCFKRERIKPDTIMATEADIEAGFKLYKKIEFANELGLSPYIYKIYEDVVEPLLRNVLKDSDGEPVEGKTTQEILKKHYEVRHKTLSPDTLKNILLQLESVGMIRLEQDKTDKRRTVVYPTVTFHISSRSSDIQNYMEPDSGVNLT